jgi:hypothetical protein
MAALTTRQGGRPTKDNTNIFFQAKIWPCVTIRGSRPRRTDRLTVSNKMTWPDETSSVSHSYHHTELSLVFTPSDHKNLLTGHFSSLVYPTNIIAVLLNVYIQVEILWIVTPCKRCGRISCCLHLQVEEDEGSTDLCNVGILPQHYTASQSRGPRLQSS